MVGGMNSFGVGGYYRTPIEEVLPVKLKAPDQEESQSSALALVVDRSGSMAEYTNTVSGSYSCRYGRKTYTCYTYYDKITALKMAATNLMTQLASADPAKTLVRTAAVSYNASMPSPGPQPAGCAGFAKFHLGHFSSLQLAEG